MEKIKLYIDDKLSLNVDTFSDNELSNMGINHPEFMELTAIEKANGLSIESIMDDLLQDSQKRLDLNDVRTINSINIKKQ